jgi:Nickel responsive protein SCO4226-like
MPKFVIERDLPGAARLSPAELKAISQKSNGVLRDLGPEIQWVESYVTGDKIYCVYVAPSAEVIREHARRGGFPANRIEQVAAVIDPTTADG